MFTHPNAIKFLQCAQLVCRMEGDGDFLMQARIEVTLPTLMGRSPHYSSREDGDDEFAHVASMFVLWCLTHRPHARQLLLLADEDDENYIDDDWAQWAKHFKIRKREDDKDQKKKMKRKKYKKRSDV